MVRLLKLEWMKIRKYRAFLILLALYAVSLVGINYMVFNSLSKTSIGNPMAAAFIGNPFSFPEVWQSVSYLSSFLFFIPGLMIILLMANEYSFRTNRQSVINGLNRSQFIGAKILLLLAIALLATLLAFVVAALLGLTGEPPFSLHNVKYIGYFFVAAMSHMSVALVIILLFKRSGISIGLYFLYIFIVENLLSVFINKLVPKAGFFLPLESADKLIPVPSTIGKMLQDNPPDATYLLIAACVWIAACPLFCKYRFEKSDL